MARRHVSTIVSSSFITISLSSTGVPYFFGKFQEDSEIFDINKQPNSTLENIIAICRGTDHVVCLNNEGKVFTFGLDKMAGLENLFHFLQKLKSFIIT